MDAPYIIYPHGGLTTRLKVLLSWKATGHPIICFWPKTRLCNGLFRDCFEPIDGVTFRYEEPALEQTMDYEGTAVQNDIDITVLKPLPSLMQRIINNRTFLNDYDAVHVRRTDFTGTRVADSEFFAFIDEGDGKTPIFLAADDIETQIVFSKKYKGLIRINKALKRSSAVRQSSLEDAVIDMFVCAAAKFFMGTTGSAFTELIELLRGPNSPYSYDSIAIANSIIPNVVAAPAEAKVEVEEAPVEEAVEEAPVEAPVEEAVEEVPVEEEPVEAPVEEAPVEGAVEDAPVEEAPVEEAPVEEAPVEDAPVEEAPVEEAPVEEAPVEEAVEEAPVEEVKAASEIIIAIPMAEVKKHRSKKH